MTAPPQISDIDIRSRVGVQSFQRGRSYADNGRVIATRRQGNTLKALCLGSVPVPYRLRVTIGSNGEVTEANCTCPVGAGGYCKHIAALLLTWLEHPEAFTESPDLQTVLQDKSKEDLIELLLTVADGDPQFEQLLETTVGADRDSPSPGVEFYRQQVETAIEPLEHHWDFSSGGYGYGGEIPAIAAKGDAMLQREDWRGASDVYRGVLEGVRESNALAYDEEGGLVESLWRSIVGLGICLERMEDPDARRGIVDTLFETFYVDISVLGGVDLSVGIPEILIFRTTPEERDYLIERVQEVMPPEDEWAHGSYSFFVAELETEKLSGEEYIERCRELGLIDRLVDSLLTLGRNDEAVQAATGAESYELEMLVPIFSRHGLEDLIEPVVRRRVRSGTRPYYVTGGRNLGVNLDEWLTRYYRDHGDYAQALDMAMRALEKGPSLDGYREARELAELAQEWPAKRFEMMEVLDRQAKGLKALVHLEEGELDEAIAIVRRDGRNLYYTGIDVPVRVADAVAQERPDAAFDIYLRKVNDLIAARGRGNYQIAASLLSRVQDIYDRLDRYEEWEELIERLRSDNYRLPALQEELDKADL